MNYSFEYIDIILLATIVGFIFLRLRGILGKKAKHEEKISTNFSHEFIKEKKNEKNFDENAKSEFLNGAKISYETIITNFSKGNLKEKQHFRWAAAKRGFWGAQNDLNFDVFLGCPK